MTTGSFERVRTCVGWDSDDRARIDNLRRCLDSDLSRVVEALASQLATFKGTQVLMSNTRFVQHLHGVLREWLTGLLEGAFDDEYVAERLAFGRELVAIDLAFEDVIMLEELARSQLFEFAREGLRENPRVISATMRTLEKAFNLDLALIYTAYLEVREARLERVLLDRFLAVTGFSRTLYENLAEARGWASEVQR